VSWTTLLTGYAELKHDAEALNCLEQMQCEGYSPDVVTYACILKSCGNIAASDKGGQTHAEIVREGLVGKFCILDTALVDMYAKCGKLEKAQQVFDEIQVRNVVLWTALIGGYAQIRKLDAVFSIFNRMVGEGVKPNLITFTVVLNACTYLGLVEQGQSYFEVMSESYGIVPSLGHWSCMINLFAGSGHFDKAMAVIKQLPSSGHLTVWASLLGSCRKWENVKLGRLAFEHAVQLDGKSAMPDSFMCSTYTTSGTEKARDKIEAYIG
jgi:pentatricopeptide repeat protein